MEVSNTKFDDKDYKFMHMCLTKDDKFILLSSGKENLHLINVENPKKPKQVYVTKIGFLALGIQFSPDY